MKHILLPTDFSENSWNAISYAIQLFKEDFCTFHLFNAYTPVVYDVSYVLISPAQFGFGDEVRHASQENLKELKSKISREFGSNSLHQFETIARFETLVSGIKELIEERNIDLVVMGTKGATGAKEILFGSNTVQVFSEVKCPLMAVPSNFPYHPPQSVLFPTDLEVDFEETKLHLLEEMSALNRATLNAMHVSTGYNLTQDQERHKKALSVLFATVLYKFHEVENMDIADAITKYRETHDVDMLVMINNKRSFFENVFFKNTVNQIGFHLDIPFLVMPSK